jgi:hypothetical protein
VNLSYTTDAISEAFSFVQNTRALHLALALFLLFAGFDDLGHQHADSGADVQCYAGHFSPDLGVAVDVLTFRLHKKPGDLRPSGDAQGVIARQKSV